LQVIKPDQNGKIHWVKLTILFVGFLVVSAGIGYLLQILLVRFHIPEGIPAWLVYLILFGVTLVVNLSLIPLPFALSLMIAASTKWNPIMVALSASLGASIGEFSSYLIGYFGTKIAINDKIIGYQMIQKWIKRWGVWAIAFLSFQPILPIEIGGFIAGLAKMPVRLFLPALWLGKFPKYLIVIYAAQGIIHFIPFFHPK
jgi:membrane protein YqaA with SNARE-associated domain